MMMMQMGSNARKISRVFKGSHQRLFALSNVFDEVKDCDGGGQFGLVQLQKQRGICNEREFHTSGIIYRSQLLIRVTYATKACSPDEGPEPTDEVKKIYDKMWNIVNKEQKAPPNVLLGSLIEKCVNEGDIKLLFQMLEKLRIFRLSNLRIHVNFPDKLCLQVVEACVRAGALDYGKRGLLERNVYGLTPSVGIANCLLTCVKEHSNIKLMDVIIKLMQINHVPLGPTTADIVFSICYNANNWDLISKYSKTFIKAKVNFRQTTYNTWMEFAAKIGDVEALEKIEKLRAKVRKHHTICTGISCAKGLLLKHEPESAAAFIHILSQKCKDTVKRKIAYELQKLISDWPLEVINSQKNEGDKQALATSLKNDIPVMINALLSTGFEANVTLDDLAKIEAIPS